MRSHMTRDSWGFFRFFPEKSVFLRRLCFFHTEGCIVSAKMGPLCCSATVPCWLSCSFTDRTIMSYLATMFSYKNARVPSLSSRSASKREAARQHLCSMIEFLLHIKAGSFLMGAGGKIESGWRGFLPIGSTSPKIFSWESVLAPKSFMWR